jgi:hypothetical protein
MSSGRKKMVINTRERAVSDDINRLQQFAAADTMEAWRYLLNVQRGTLDLAAGAVALESTTQDAPLKAEIIGGLLVKPQLASTSCLVDGGVIFMLDPDGATGILPGGANDPADSLYKFVKDAGVTSLGALTVAANASGSIRIDVVECQRIANVILESSNRDIFDTTTGTFTASSQTKVQRDELVYRVRQGAAGAGYPAAVQGWLPLAVISVPNGSVNLDTCTIWDVRPLVNDRIQQPFNASRSRPVVRKCAVTGTPAACAGLIEAEFGTRKVGGRLRRGTPGVDAETLDVTDAANQEAGIAFTANRPWQLYLLTPFGLPRWARYTDATSGSRVPRNPLGIPVVSMIPADGDGNPSAAIALPASTGLGGTTSSAMAVYSGYNTPGGVQKLAVGNNDDGLINVNALTTGGPIEVVGTPSDPDIRKSWSSFLLTSGTHFPANAKAILVDMRCLMTIAAPAITDADINVWAFLPNGGAQYMNLNTGGKVTNVTGSAEPRHPRALMWIPLPSVYPLAAAYTIQLLMEIFNESNGLTMGCTTSLPLLRVLGWKL